MEDRSRDDKETEEYNLEDKTNDDNRLASIHLISVSARQHTSSTSLGEEGNNISDDKDLRKPRPPNEECRIGLNHEHNPSKLHVYRRGE